MKDVLNEKRTNIRIRDIEVYHGSKIIDNSFYIEHFKKQGKDITHFLEDICGRKKRYLIDEKKENSLTMAQEVCKKLLKKSKLEGKEIDMIVFSSVLPQYVSPPCSVIIHNTIEGKMDCFCQDININCAGMTYALDMIYRNMSANSNINKVLLVGSDYLNFQISPDDTSCYGQFGDAACALILEKTEEECGLIDSKPIVHSDGISDIVFPKCGFTNIFEGKKEDFLAVWNVEECPWLDTAIISMKDLINENNLELNDISMFCLSQYTYKNIEYLREKLNITEKNSLYIGDTYGYTGTTSPFIALYTAIENGQVKRGDNVMLWTVGAGYFHIAVLLKY